MDNKELMIPRIRIKALTPTTQLKIGDIVKLGKNGYELPEGGLMPYTLYLPEDQVSKFEHLYEKLPWYAYRTAADLPRYIMVPDGKPGRKDAVINEIYEIESWHANMVRDNTPTAKTDSLPDKHPNRSFLSVNWHFYKEISSPSTKEEYEAYIKSRNPTASTT